MIYKHLYKKELEENIIPVIIAINALLLMNPYFVWETYSMTISQTVNLIILLGMTFQVFCILKASIHKKTFFLALLIVLYYAYIFFNGYKMNLIMYLKIGGIFIQLIFFIVLPVPKRIKTYKIFVSFFALSLVIPITIWLFIQLDIPVNYNVLQAETHHKVAEGYYYKQYFGAVFLDSYIAPNTFYRLCGIFDEPGVVGTLAAFILVAENGDMHKKKNWIILLGGILAFSLAFIGLILTYICIKHIIGCFKRYKVKKKVFIFLLSLIVGSIVFPILYNNSYVKIYVLNKIQRSIGKDSRNTKGFKENYDIFLKNGSLYRYLVGYGYNATALNPKMSGSNSYKIQIYDLGLVGFISLYFIAYYACLKEKNKKTSAVRILFIIFCISTYQRISIFTLSNFILLVGGSDCLKYRGEINEYNNWYFNL